MPQFPWGYTWSYPGHLLIYQSFFFFFFFHYGYIPLVEEPGSSEDSRTGYGGNTGRKRIGAPSRG